MFGTLQAQPSSTHPDAAEEVTIDTFPELVPALIITSPVTKTPGLPDHQDSTTRTRPGFRCQHDFRNRMRVSSLFASSFSRHRADIRIQL